MFGFSGEHLVILAIVILIFGPRRLPELANGLGKAMRNFKDALSGVEEAKFRRIDRPEEASDRAAGGSQQAATHGSDKGETS